MKCAVTIAPGALMHEGLHKHAMHKDLMHYCDVKCANCGYVCTLPYGHPQNEHSTRHGSMTMTRWVVEDGGVIEIDGHRFGSNDDGALMACNAICNSLGRHVHVDYCRSSDTEACQMEEKVEHVLTPIGLNPDQPKDWITHRLYWSRLGFRDPYKKGDQTEFAKCDAICPGSEHQATDSSPAIPSYCILPMFHQPATPTQLENGGYVSKKGHLFSCKDPAVRAPAFHIIFVIDRSGSMSSEDNKPLPGAPESSRIKEVADNRLGAVYSSLYTFWSARAEVMKHASIQDSYDFRKSPKELLDSVLEYSSDGETNFSVALSQAEQAVEDYWSTERAPIVVFLSDGECSVSDDVVYSLCDKAVHLGRALSFQAISFGTNGHSDSLRNIAQIAKEVQDRSPLKALSSTDVMVRSQYDVVLNSEMLVERFLDIGKSLRAGLIREELF